MKKGLGGFIPFDQMGKEQTPEPRFMTWLSGSWRGAFWWGVLFGALIVCTFLAFIVLGWVLWETS